MQYAIGPRIPLVEGLVVNTNGGIIDTRTEVANSLHPLLSIGFARGIVLKIWDSAVGGTPKAISSLLWDWRTTGGTATWNENVNPHSSGGGFITNAQTSYSSLRAGVSILIQPVAWGAAAIVSDIIPVDDIAFRFTTDATVNPATFNIDAYVMRQLG